MLDCLRQRLEAAGDFGATGLCRLLLDGPAPGQERLDLDGYKKAADGQLAAAEDHAKLAQLLLQEAVVAL